MKMRWTDLEVGDTLCFNPEFEPAFQIKFGRRPTFSDIIDKHEFFIIKRIDLSDKKCLGISLDISVRNVNFHIMKESGTLYKFESGPALFKVCGLAK